MRSSARAKSTSRRRRRTRATGRLSAPREGGTLGFRGAADYRFSDAWNFGAQIETESNSTPLRGQRAGINSSLFALSAGYARNESAGVRAHLRYQEFSDKNSGLSALLLTSATEKHSYPVVVMTSEGGERMAVEAMKAGALDYVVKTPYSKYPVYLVFLQLKNFKEHLGVRKINREFEES